MCASKICTTLSFLILCFLTFSNAGSDCLNPNQEKGYCITIKECPVLKELQRKLASTDDKQFLEESNCTNGFGEPPFVCCTNDASFQTHTRFSNDLLPGLEDCGDQPSGSKIYSGKETELDEFSWTALLNYGSDESPQFFCAGSLINSRYVLTAAHCVVDKQLHSVRLGEYDISKPIDCIDSDCADPIQDINVEDVIIHPNFNMESIHRHNDIALIRLKNQVHYTSFISPVCMPSTIGLTRSDVGTNLIATGWGKTLEQKNSNIKLKISLPVNSQVECQKAFRRTKTYLLDFQLCAGGKFIEDTCTGDSGGPLMYFKGKWAIEGIVSYSRGCGIENIPGIYTRVVDYEDWIKSNLKP